MSIPMLVAERRWYCPNCDCTDVTHESQPHSRFHFCQKLGITAPMIPAGIRAKVEAFEREDYIQGEDVQLNEQGRPIMQVVTTRDDGTDVAVYAPTAHGRLG